MKKTPKPSKKKSAESQIYNLANVSSTFPSVAEKDGQIASTSSTPSESQPEPTEPSDIKKEDTIPYSNISAAVLSSLPPYLKDPQYYGKINKVLYDAFLGSCAGHSDIAEWGSCVKCQKAFTERGHLMKKLGFATPAHYLLWKKTHEIMRKKLRIPYPKYNKN